MSFVKQVILDTINFVFYLIVAVVLMKALRQYVFQPFQVSGQSMFSTLHDQDQMLMWKHIDLERFDIVVFPEPHHHRESYVKRVIGMPGDQIVYKDDQLYVNGHPVEENFLNQVKENSKETFTEDFDLRSLTGLDYVPAGHVFVLGDNRPKSGDSRQFGFIPISEIEGEADFIYYPFSRFGNINKREEH